jgi:glycosyltransferase involved in cell wall biosynthesis
LLDIFPKVVRQNRNARLVVLARGASQQQCDDILNELRSTESDTNISIVGGWLTKEQVLSYIELSDVVTLPFVLVPSDIPVAVLEALARGKPVVASPVDGLPELVNGRGVIIDPLDSHQFATELCNLSEDKQRISHYANSARVFIKNYPKWHDVGLIMDEICNDDLQGMK